MPATKELEFFSYQDHLLNPGFKQYLEHFSDAAQTPVVGEATASYFWTTSGSRWSTLPNGFQTNIPKTVHHYLGDDLKLVVILRNPVMRAISAYLHYLAMGEITTQEHFTTAMAYGGVIDMGFYARHLQNWLEYYPPGQIRVLVLESDIKVRPVETLASVCRFLSVGDYDFNHETVRQSEFAGTERIINENGVFIAGNDPSGNTDDGDKNDSFEDEKGQYWRQILCVQKLRQLNDIYLGDVKDLDMMLGTRLVQQWAME